MSDLSKFKVPNGFRCVKEVMFVTTFAELIVSDLAESLMILRKELIKHE